MAGNFRTCSCTSDQHTGGCASADVGLLVGVEAVQVTYLAERPPHVFDDLHVIECRLQRLSSGVHRIHRCLSSTLGYGSGLLGGDPRCLPGFSQALLLVPDLLENLPMLVATFPHFFRQSPILFRFVPGGLRRDAAPFCGPAVLLSVLAPVLSRTHDCLRAAAAGSLTEAPSLTIPT
jgi:hypothetical protein